MPLKCSRCYHGPGSGSLFASSLSSLKVWLNSRLRRGLRVSVLLFYICLRAHVLIPVPVPVRAEVGGCLEVIGRVRM